MPTSTIITMPNDTTAPPLLRMKEAGLSLFLFKKFTNHILYMQTTPGLSSLTQNAPASSLASHCLWGGLQMLLLILIIIF
jgi:hypothetical protein